MTDQAPHHEILLDHVAKIAAASGKDADAVLTDMETSHPELHEHIKKVVAQTGVSREHVLRVLRSHVHESKHDHGTPRSNSWPTYRKHWLHGSPKDGVAPHPTCAACGSKVGPQVHHKTPFQRDHSLELCYSNYITLCESITDEHGKPGLECHLHVGHAGLGFHTWNPNVEKDAAELLKHPERRSEILDRIKKNAKPIS
jgi:hypothetical protein